MYQKTLSSVLRTNVRPPKSMRSLNWRRFLEIYFGNVDAQDVVYIPCSALGHTPQIDRASGQLCVRPAQIKPMWVEVPLVYALSRWMRGLVPYLQRHHNLETRAYPPVPMARRRDAV